MIANGFSGRSTILHERNSRRSSASLYVSTSQRTRSRAARGNPWRNSQGSRSNNSQTYPAFVLNQGGRRNSRGDRYGSRRNNKTYFHFLMDSKYPFVSRVVTWLLLCRLFRDLSHFAKTVFQVNCTNSKYQLVRVVRISLVRSRLLLRLYGDKREGRFTKVIFRARIRRVICGFLDLIINLSLCLMSAPRFSRIICVNNSRVMT